MNQILAKLKEANEAYRSGNPIMSDSEYDNLLLKLPKDHSYRNSIEPEQDTASMFKHPIPMLSTQKAKTDVEVLKWIAKVKSYSNKTIDIRVTAKLDGLAGIYYPSGELVTRGNGTKGNIVTSAFRKGVVNLSNSYGIGELVMVKDYFDNYLKDDFAHPRNVVVGIVMGDKVKPKVQQALDSNAVHFAQYKDIFSITVSIENFENNYRVLEETVRKNTPYPIDGVVIEVVDENIKVLMGGTDHHKNYVLALKPKDESSISTVIDIEWNTGRTGKVTPVIIIEPIDLDGAIIKRCTGHNAKKIIDMEIEIGCTVSIVRSGGVIPYCTGRI